MSRRSERTGTNISRNARRAGGRPDRPCDDEVRARSKPPRRACQRLSCTDGQRQCPAVRSSTWPMRDGMLTGMTQIRLSQARDRSDWQHAGRVSIARPARASIRWRSRPTAIRLFVLKKTDGRDALYRMVARRHGDDDAGRARSEGRHRRCRADRRGPARDRLHLRRRPAPHGLFRSRISRSCRHSLGKALAEPAARSTSTAPAPTATKLLIFAGSGHRSRALIIVLDRTTKKLSELALVRPALDEQPLAPVKSVTLCRRATAPRSRPI